jgi:hypothetical protein
MISQVISGVVKTNLFRNDEYDIKEGECDGWIPAEFLMVVSRIVVLSDERFVSFQTPRIIRQQMYDIPKLPPYAHL